MLMKLSYEGCMLSKEEIKVDMNEFVRVWKEQGNYVEKRAWEDDEDKDESSDEEDATFEAMNHEPSIIEEENPQEDAFLFHQEFLKIQDRTLSTYVLNKKVEINVLLPLNPPFKSHHLTLINNIFIRDSSKFSISQTCRSYDLLFYCIS